MFRPNGVTAQLLSAINKPSRQNNRSFKKAASRLFTPSLPNVRLRSNRTVDAG
jgi:hypothetical protein